MEWPKIKIHCCSEQKELIKKALIVSGECPIGEECDAECEECVDEKIEWDLAEESKGLFECFNCGKKMAVWDGDFDEEDGDGVKRMLHCENCGAEIEYHIREEGDE